MRRLAADISRDSGADREGGAKCRGEGCYEPCCRIWFVTSSCDRANATALAFDLAATNVLNEAKAKGTPWDVAKGLETFTQLGRTLPVVPDVRHWTLTCKVCPITNATAGC